LRLTCGKSHPPAQIRGNHPFLPQINKRFTSIRVAGHLFWRKIPEIDLNWLVEALELGHLWFGLHGQFVCKIPRPNP
jgi:hypothetical protein